MSGVGPCPAPTFTILQALVGSGAGGTHPGIGIVPAPASVALVPNRNRLGSLLVRVTTVATLGAPVNVTCAATSRLWPTVTLGAETAPPETLAVMPLAPAAGVLKPVGGVAESVVAPMVRAVNVVVYAVSAGVNVTDRKSVV